MDSEYIKDGYVKEANEERNRLRSFEDPFRNGLCETKRLSRSNFELNANTPFKNQFTLFWKIGQKGFSKYKLKPCSIKTYCKYKTTPFKFYLLIINLVVSDEITFQKNKLS